MLDMKRIYDYWIANYHFDGINIEYSRTKNAITVYAKNSRFDDNYVGELSPYGFFFGEQIIREPSKFDYNIDWLIKEILLVVIKEYICDFEIMIRFLDIYDECYEEDCFLEMVKGFIMRSLDENKWWNKVKNV